MDLFMLLFHAKIDAPLSNYITVTAHIKYFHVPLTLAWMLANARWCPSESDWSCTPSSGLHLIPVQFPPSCSIVIVLLCAPVKMHHIDVLNCMDTRTQGCIHICI